MDSNKQSTPRKFLLKGSSNAQNFRESQSYRLTLSIEAFPFLKRY